MAEKGETKWPKKEERPWQKRRSRWLPELRWLLELCVGSWSSALAPGALRWLLVRIYLPSLLGIYLVIGIRTLCKSNSDIVVVIVYILFIGIRTLLDRVTGDAADKFFWDLTNVFSQMHQIASLLGMPPDHMISRIGSKSKVRVSGAALFPAFFSRARVLFFFSCSRARALYLLFFTRACSLALAIAREATRSLPPHPPFPSSPPPLSSSSLSTVSPVK